MKRAGIILLATLLGASWSLSVKAQPPAGTAPNQGSTPATGAPNQGAETSAGPGANSPRRSSGRVTQAEVASLLVNLLGLGRFLPAAPTDQERSTILMQQRIAPVDGWVPDAVVTKGDLAVILVKTLRAMGELVDIDLNNSRAAIAWLREQGIPIDTVGQGLSVVGPLSHPFVPNVFNPSVDPLSRRGAPYFSSTDEEESGTLAGPTPYGPRDANEAPPPITIEEVVEIIQEITRPDAPTTSMTPFQPRNLPAVLTPDA